MTLDSIVFISCFLPLSLLLHWVIPGVRLKNAVLLVLSLVFYAVQSVAALPVLAGCIVLTYGAGLLLQKGWGKKWVLGCAVAVNVGLLAAYKYLDFLLVQVLGQPALATKLVAPLGISFFVFKSISYLADAFRDGKNATRNLGHLALYISFFPQIAMGPITRFESFAPQLKVRSISLDTTAQGLRRFIVGLAKRVVVSAPLGILVDGVFAAALPDARLAWLGAVGYCLQLYFDFSGFIDMAIGLGVMFGFTTCENFNHPYTALGIGDFWRRWHMSLSGWFKDYAYIPLGGNRKGGLRAGVNKSIVFLLCGLWHGANWTFLLWGIWHGLLSMLESLQLIPIKRLCKQRTGRVLCRAYTLLAVCLGFVMFRAASVTEGFAMLGAMFTGFEFTHEATVLLHRLLTGQSVLMLVLGVVLSVLVARWMPKSKAWQMLSYVGALLLLVLCILRLAAGNFAPSIYAQF